MGKLNEEKASLLSEVFTHTHTNKQASKQASEQTNKSTILSSQPIAMFLIIVQCPFQAPDASHAGSGPRKKTQNSIDRDATLEFTAQRTTH